MAVGTDGDLAGYEARRRVDCRGKLVLPGFVDCHNHLFEAMLRGIGDGMALWPWLSKLMMPFTDRVTREEALAAVRVAAIEAIRNGTTCVLDNHYAPVDLDTTLAVSAAIESTGLRGVVARGMYGPRNNLTDSVNLDLERTFIFSIDDEISITRAAMEARPPGSKVAVWPAPEHLVINEQELVVRAVELAREFGTGWHTHICEVKSDPELYLEHYGIRPIAWMHQEGLLEGATLAHGVWLDNQDIEYVGEAHTGIAHCPISNEYLASGVIRLRELRSAGAVVGLGSDGSCVGNQDIIQAMRHAVLLQRVHTLDSTSVTAEDVMEMATLDGARYIGIEAGQLAPGKLADLVVLGLEAPQAKPFNHALGAVVYHGRGSDVEMTIVGGEIVYEDGRCTMIDEAAVIEEAQARADEVFDRLGLTRFRTHWKKQAISAPGKI